MSSDAINMDKITEEILLFDFYGKLLTEKQQEIFTLYYQENYSLAEISDMAEITRQGVHEQLKKARGFLEDCEDKLGLLLRFRNKQESIDCANKLIDELYSRVGSDEAIVDRLDEVKKLINNLLD